MHSPGEVVPGSRDPGSGGLHRLLGGEVWIVTCARTQASWWLQQQPEYLMPRGKKKCLAFSAAPDLFPDSLPASCGTLAPFRLCSRRQPQSSPWDLTSEARASAPSPCPPRRVSRRASRAGECWSALILRAGISPLCPPHPCGCALLRGSEASPLRHPQSPPAKGLPSAWKPFLLHSSLPLVQVPSLFFCLCFFFFLLP